MSRASTLAKAIGADGAVAVSGNTTLGDASTDTVTINAATASIPNGINFTNGNFGVGGTPSAWYYPAVSLANGSFYSRPDPSSGIAANAYSSTSGGGWKYIATAAASRYEQSAGAHAWSIAGSGTAGNAITFNTAMTLDASGRLGIAATPESGWEAGRSVIQLATAGFDTKVAGQVLVRANNYWNGTNDKYISNGYATAYEQSGGTHRWYTAASGTAGNNVSFTPVGVFDASGNFGVGTTSPASTFVVSKNASGARGGEISIVNGATAATNNSAALNFGVEPSTYAGDDGNAQIKALLTNAATSATDMVFSNWSGSAFNETMRIDATGRRTNPYQSYAWVRFSFTSGSGTWQHITGSTSVAGVGGNWNTGTNRFTAPVAGRYLAFAGGYSTTAGTNERYAMGFYKNGTLLQFCGGNLSSGDTPLSGAPFVFDLAAGDYLELWMYTAVAMTMTATTNHSLYAQFYLVG